MDSPDGREERTVNHHCSRWSCVGLVCGGLCLWPSTRDASDHSSRVSLGTFSAVLCLLGDRRHFWGQVSSKLLCAAVCCTASPAAGVLAPDCGF